MGFSSPVIGGDLIFLTGAEGGALKDIGKMGVVDEGGKLYTIAVDRRSGKIAWKREAPRPRIERYRTTNTPASASPVTDGQNVFVFFGDYGLLSYTKDGVERWRAPLGPFHDQNGHGSSPILYRDLVIMVCDDDVESYLIAVDKQTGRVRWKTPRPDITRGYVTPVVFEHKDGPAELIAPEAYQLISYFAETGEKAWWVRGLSWQPKSSPVVDGDMIYMSTWETSGDVAAPPAIPAFAEMLAKSCGQRIKRLGSNT